MADSSNSISDGFRRLLKDAFTEAFISDLLARAGMDVDEPQVRLEMIAELRGQLEENVLQEVQARLGPGEFEQLRELVQHGAAHTEIESYLRQQGGDLEEILTVAMQQLRSFYVTEQS